MSTDGYVGKQSVVYTYNEAFSATERNEILTYATTWTNLENIVLSEIHQTQKDRYYCLIVTEFQFEKTKDGRL